MHRLDFASLLSQTPESYYPQFALELLEKMDVRTAMEVTGHAEPWLDELRLVVGLGEGDEPFWYVILFCSRTVVGGS
jgi:hypothetical protein